MASSPRPSPGVSDPQSCPDEPGNPSPKQTVQVGTTAAVRRSRAPLVDRADSMTPSLEAEKIIRLIGVYNADSTLRGELSYWVGARLGRAHCALCNITHGSVREKRDWKQCRAGLPVPFDSYHRNDQPDTVRSAAGGLVPIVVAETNAGIVALLGPTELDGCAGHVHQLTAAIERAVDERGLLWP